VACVNELLKRSGGHNVVLATNIRVNRMTRDSGVNPWGLLNVASVQTKHPFMEQAGSRLGSDELATGPYAEEGGASSYPHSISFKVNFVILLSHLCPGIQNYLIPSGFPAKVQSLFLSSSVHSATS
jgi:hypothetical protein